MNGTGAGSGLITLSASVCPSTGDRSGIKGLHYVLQFLGEIHLLLPGIRIPGAATTSFEGNILSVERLAVAVL